MMFFIADDLGEVAKCFEECAQLMRKRANANKGQGKSRDEGEAYAYEQAARTLRDLKWAHEVAEHGASAPYAIPRNVAPPSHSAAQGQAVSDQLGEDAQAASAPAGGLL